jgi:hypothetical protein
MANIVKPLDESAAYIYCPSCREQGNPTVMLERQMHILRCPFGHQLDATSFARLFQLKPTMTPMSELLVENPDPKCIQWKVYVLPETKEAFERKFAGRVHITIGTFVEALCSDHIIFIDGEAAGKLKEKGMGNGAQIVAAMEGMEQLMKERDAAVVRLEQVMGMLRNAGITE